MREIACQLVKIASIVFASHHLKRIVRRQIAFDVGAPRTGADARIPIVQIPKGQTEAGTRLSKICELGRVMVCLSVITRSRKGKTPCGGLSRCTFTGQQCGSNEKRQDKNGTKRNKGL